MHAATASEAQVISARQEVVDAVKSHARAMREGSLVLRNLASKERNAMLREICAHLQKCKSEIFRANKQDLEQAHKFGAAEALVKRLSFDEAKLHEVCTMLEAVAALPEKLYAPIAKRELAPQLTLTQRFVPLGVIAMIFESRPDALVQIASLCIKSGNGVLLKGGSEAKHTNGVLTRLIQEISEKYTQRFVHLLETREEVAALTSLNGAIDLIIPRGSKAFVAQIMKASSVPVLGHADGICHMYIHKDADLAMTERVLYDSKLQYYAVCNAVECVLLHTKSVIFLPQLFKRLADCGVTIHADTSEAAEILSAAKVPHTPATEEDWGREYLAKEVAIKIVNDEKEAVSFINAHGSGHTDIVMTRSEETARYFQQRVDSASVLWNCSSRFADGYRYGLGAEIGISTSRIHARGPVGIEGLFSTQWVLDGAGHTVAPFANGEARFTHQDLLLP